MKNNAEKTKLFLLALCIAAGTFVAFFGFASYLGAGNEKNDDVPVFAEPTEAVDTAELDELPEETEPSVETETGILETEAPPKSFSPPPEKLIKVDPIYQGEEYPNGCESVSAVMLLNYFGFNMSVDDFIDDYLDMAERPYLEWIGPDPDFYYGGDPRSYDGWGCNSPVILNALMRIIDDHEFVCEQSYEIPLEELCFEYVARDIPVLVWATVNMQSDWYIMHWTSYEGKPIYYNSGLHCLVLVGYDEDFYYFNDPGAIGNGENGTVVYEKDRVNICYSLVGEQSIVLYPREK